MGLRIITGEEAAKQKSRVNKAILGPTGIGKTSLLWTLPAEETLFIDLEAGGLAIDGWKGDRIKVFEEAQRLKVHPWMLARALACLIAGPDPTDQTGPYGQAAYDQYKTVIDPASFDKYNYLFIDSITQVSRWSFEYTQQFDPAAFSDKTGKPDTRGAYGAHGRGMVKWLTVLQHQANRTDGKAKSVIVVGILDAEKDDLGRVTGWAPQIVGGMAGRELPGIFDEVLSMITIPGADGQVHRALVCHTINPYLVPAKDRSGCLDTIEPPDLGHIIKKIESGTRNRAFARALPAAPPAANSMAPAAVPPQEAAAPQQHFAPPQAPAGSQADIAIPPFLQRPAPAA